MSEFEVLTMQGMHKTACAHVAKLVYRLQKCVAIELGGLAACLVQQNLDQCA